MYSTREWRYARNACIRREGLEQCKKYALIKLETFLTNKYLIIFFREYMEKLEILIYKGISCFEGPKKLN